MKPSWGLFFSSLCCTAAAARPTVSPNTARLIIAQRLGLSRFHAIEHPDAETIRHINVYGGPQPRLFGGDDADRSKAHLLIWREHGPAADGASVVTFDDPYHISDLAISAAPAPEDNDRFVKDLIYQAMTLPAPADPKKKTYISAMEIGAVVPTALNVLTHNEYLSVLRLDSSTSDESMAALWTRVQQRAAAFGFAVTFVTMPAPSAHSKRSTNPWGTYARPAAWEARRENPEMVLSSNAEPSSSPAPAVSDLEDFPAIVSQANDTRPVRGILPSCFDSKSSCEKRTHGCSGHGECVVLRKGKGSGKDQQTLDCYGCACVPTVVSHESGMETRNQTTYWGGPACQKKDISVPFWIFVMVGVTMAFLISAGIGMLYSMGSEELPSVIGAGVSGPIRK